MDPYKFARLYEEEEEGSDGRSARMDPKKAEEETNVRQSKSRRILLGLLFLLVLMGFYQYFFFIFQLTEDGIRCFSPYSESCTFSQDKPRTLLQNLYGAKMFKPEQLHLSLGSDGKEIFVTWSTKAPTKCYLKFNGLEDYCFTYDDSFTECYEPVTRESTRSQLMAREYRAPKRNVSQTMRRILYTYRANMTNLSAKPHLYFVECSDPKDPSLKYRSDIYQFKMNNYDDPDRELAIAFYGDLGLVNGQSVPRLIKDVDEGRYDFIIHNGDFAYDLNTENGRYGDEFMREIEPIAARVPYQTSVGNHEVANNFSHYDHRFTMVQSGGAKRNGTRNNFFYSFNAGPVHFIGFSTEFYYFIDYIGIEPLVRQYDWLVEDLKHATSLTERQIRPWIVVFGHRPMYCSSRDGDDCSKETNILRKGLPFTGGYALEKLFYDYGVDIELYSHEHQYERFLPIFDGKVMNGTDPERPYYNPRAPVHVISGSAGCQERLDPFKGKAATGSVKQIHDYGYTRIYANRTTLRFEQISDDQQGIVVDAFILEKDKQNFPQ